MHEEMAWTVVWNTLRGSVNSEEAQKRNGLEEGSPFEPLYIWKAMIISPIGALP